MTLPPLPQGVLRTEGDTECQTYVVLYFNKLHIVLTFILKLTQIQKENIIFTKLQLL